MTLHDALKAGYRIEQLKAHAIAEAAARVMRRTIQSLPVLRKG